MKTLALPASPGKCNATWEERIARRQDETRELVEGLIAELAVAVRSVQDAHVAEWLSGIGLWPGGTSATATATGGRPEVTSPAVEAAQSRVAGALTFLAQAVAREAFVRVTERFDVFAYMLWPSEGLWANGGEF